MRKLVLILILILLACASGPEGRYYMGRPQPLLVAPDQWSPDWQAAWALAWRCAGTERRLGVSPERVRITMTSFILKTPEGQELAGLWVYPHDIYLSVPASTVVVHHEFLHEMFGQAYSDDDEVFRRCDPLAGR